MGRTEKALRQRALLRLFGMPDIGGEGRVDGDARFREPRLRHDEILGREEVSPRTRQASGSTDQMDRPRHRRDPERRTRQLLLVLAGLVARFRLTADACPTTRTSPVAGRSTSRPSPRRGSVAASIFV